MLNLSNPKPEKIRVLFMQSQSYFGSDSMIHSLFMRYLDRSRVEVHASVNPGRPNHHSPAYQALSSIPDLHLRPTNYGITVNSRSTRQVLLDTAANGIPMLYSLSGLASYIRKNHIQILHGTEKPRDAFYGLWLSRLTGAKLVVHLHVKIENWISPLTRYAMRYADGLVGVSDFVAQSAVDFGYDRDRVYYVLNSLDASGWDPGLDGSAVRREFGIKPQTPVLAIISRLFQWKGHRELIRALAIVKEQDPNFRLLIVGEDDQRAAPEQGSFKAELMQLVKDLGLDQQVIFTGFRRDIPQLLAAADIFSMPTFEEPCAVAFLEAMAMAKPVIALGNGGTLQLVDQGQGGLLSTPGDIDQLAANILMLLRNPLLRKQMGDYGRKRVEQYFTPERMACDLESVYRQILEKRAAK